MAIDLVIAGAGGFGREVAEVIADINKDGGKFNLLGFLDDDPEALKVGTSAYPVLEPLSQHVFSNSVKYVIAVGDVSLRATLAKRIAVSRCRLQTLVHPLAKVSKSASIGEGVVLCPFSLASTDSAVGDNVVLNVYSSVGHDSSLGMNSVLSPYVAVTGNVIVGDNTFIGARTTVTPGISIGAGSKVASGLTLTRDVEKGSFVWGNPTKSRVMFT